MPAKRQSCGGIQASARASSVTKMLFIGSSSLGLQE